MRSTWATKKAEQSVRAQAGVPATRLTTRAPHRGRRELIPHGRCVLGVSSHTGHRQTFTIMVFLKKKKKLLVLFILFYFETGILYVVLSLLELTL